MSVHIKLVEKNIYSYFEPLPHRMVSFFFLHHLTFIFVCAKCCELNKNPSDHFVGDQKYVSKLPMKCLDFLYDERKEKNRIFCVASQRPVVNTSSEWNVIKVWNA